MRCCLKKSVSSTLQPRAVHQIGLLAVNRHLGVIEQNLYPEM